MGVCVCVCVCVCGWGCVCVREMSVSLQEKGLKMPLVEEVVHVITAECKKIQFAGVATGTVRGNNSKGYLRLTNEIFSKIR